MFMVKGYSFENTEDDSLAFARVEGIDASPRDLSQVCGRITQKKTSKVLVLLEKVVDGEAPILYTAHNKNMGHRRELGGRKGAYPKKAAAAVLKVLKSAIANARVKGFGEDDLTVVHASATKKMIYGRMSAKGRKMRQNFITSRIEIILKGIPDINKKVEIKKPEKAGQKDSKTEPKKEAKQESNTTAKHEADHNAEHKSKHDVNYESKHDAKSGARELR